MKYNNITRAVFINRPNRFIAEVDIDGHKETVHVKNTGRCKELLIPGCEVWLTAPGTPDRKTKYDLVAVRKDTEILFNIDRVCEIYAELGREYPDAGYGGMFYQWLYESEPEPYGSFGNGSAMR